MAGQRLTRDLQHSMIGGVCAGFASRYDLDVTLVRVVAVLITVVTGGIGVPLYIAAWIVMPRQDSPAPAPRPASDTPDSLSRELREVSDRLAEAARVLADKTREAAEEISEIARRARTADGPATDRAPAAGGSVTGAIERRADAAEHAPEASMSETPEMANGRETGADVDESLSTSAPPARTAPPASYASPSAIPPGLPRAASDQSPNQPPPPPAGPVPPVPPAP